MNGNFMKKLQPKRTLIILLFFVAQLAEYDNMLSAQNSQLQKNLIIGITPGAVSYFGDLSVYDFEPINKLSNESGLAIDFYVGKKIERYFEFGVSATFGKVSSAKPEADTKFHSSFAEYEFLVRASLADFILPYRSLGIDFGLLTGVGISHNRSASYRISDNSIILSNGLDADRNRNGKAQNDPHLIVGYYIAWSINNNWIVEHKMSGKFLTTDNFDSFIGSTGINDRLIFTGLGVKYVINPSFTMKYRDLPCAGSREWKKFQIKKKKY